MLRPVFGVGVHQERCRSRANAARAVLMMVADGDVANDTWRVHGRYCGGGCVALGGRHGGG